ncbi:MAG: PilN domain-containing protein, partial [Armatimonadota bacterium]
MLRIDLLPEHYGLARKARLWIVIMAVILVIVALCWVGVFIVLSGKQAQRQAHLDLLKPEADAVRKLEGEASKIRGRIPQYGRKVDFIRSLEKPPEEYIDTLDKIAEYIFEGAQVTSWTISGSHASIDAEVGSTTDAGRFYINIRRCPAFRPDSIQISAFGASSARGGMMTGMEMMGGMPGME